METTPVEKDRKRFRWGLAALKEEANQPEQATELKAQEDGQSPQEAIAHGKEVPFVGFNMDEHFRKLEEQALEAQKLYPQLSLREELRNPLFARLTQPQVGLDVALAYEIAHREQLQEAAMAYALHRARENLALALQAGSLRPAENGIGPAALPPAEDPRSWSPQRRRELKERVRRGERITF